MALWIIRILFLAMCTVGGFAVSQVRPEFVVVPSSSVIGMAAGFGFGWLMIGVDELLKDEWRQRSRPILVMKNARFVVFWFNGHELISQES